MLETPCDYPKHLRNRPPSVLASPQPRTGRYEQKFISRYFWADLRYIYIYISRYFGADLRYTVYIYIYLGICVLIWSQSKIKQYFPPIFFLIITNILLNHNIYIFNFIFVIKNKNKDANKP